MPSQMEVLQDRLKQITWRWWTWRLTGWLDLDMVVEIEVDNFGTDRARPPGLLEGLIRNLRCFMVAFSLFIGTWNWFEGADIVHLV